MTLERGSEAVFAAYLIAQVVACVLVVSGHA